MTLIPVVELVETPKAPDGSSGAFVAAKAPSLSTSFTRAWFAGCGPLDIALQVTSGAAALGPATIAA